MDIEKDSKEVSAAPENSGKEENQVHTLLLGISVLTQN